MRPADHPPTDAAASLGGSASSPAAASLGGAFAVRPAGRRLQAPPGTGGHVVTAATLLAVLLLPTPAVETPDPDFAAPVLTLSGLWRETAWAWALSIALAVPLLLRHRAPVAAFAGIAAMAFLQWLAGPPLYADLVVLVALYGAVAHVRTARGGAFVAGVVALGLILAIQRWGNASVASAISLGAMVATPVAFGLLARSRTRILAATREHAIQSERSRIAREMHDVVTHNLSVMVALADGARLTIDADPAQATTAIDHIARTGRDGLADMRRLLGALRDDDDRDAAPRVPAPGLGDLTTLVESVRLTGVAVDLERRALPPLSAGEALTVHRVVQEALTNVLRHAPDATQVRVSVRPAEVERAVEVEIDDDGGPTAARTPGPRSGLSGMAERVALHGGRLDAGPTATGWRVVACLPLDRAGVA